RRPDRLASEAHGSFVLGSFLASWFTWFVHPVVWAALRLGLGPTFFNLLGAGLGIGAGWAFAGGHLTAGGWLVLGGGVADILDGRIARAQGVASGRGAFLDSTLDRFAEVGAFIGLVVLFRASAVGAALAATALGGSLLVSYARARGESQGVVCKYGVMQRAERLLLVGFGALFDPAVSTRWGQGEPGLLLLPLLALVAVGTVGTAVYRTVWIARALESGAAGRPTDDA
ncbi:MAG: CDP-alcohol phosphatidyltransferase family protein, partial [Gemmatimonadetes bacterium]